MNVNPQAPEKEGRVLRSSFFGFTTTRPVAITMVVIAVVVFGLVSYQRLSLNLMPDISYPSVTVRTEYPGTAPEEIESVVSRPLEQALGVVSGLVTVSSISKAGVSDIVMEFDWGTDLDEAMSQIREKVDKVDFPPEVKRPMMLRYDPSMDPIVRLAVSGDSDLYRLRLLSEDEIERQLEKLPGVAAVKVMGGLEEEVVVELEESRLNALNLGLDRVSARLAEENVNMAGGQLREGDTQYLVRTLNEFGSLGEISDLVIEDRGSAPVRVSDLGRVYRGHKEREVITRVGGKESVEIEVYKEADANVVAVAREIATALYGTDEQRKYVASQQKDSLAAQGKKDLVREKRMTNFIACRLPKGAKIQTLFDQSVFIQSSIDEVRNSAIMGGLLAMLVLFVFLRTVSSTLIISLAIPISIIATFAPMYMFGVDLNIMSLGGLALGVGMLVDNSIVVLESIFRCRVEGDDTVRAAIRGTGEVGGAVLASTLTTVAVFFPIVFVEGVAGQIFGDMALTVVFSLLASLLVALFVIPMLASRRVQGGSGLVADQTRAFIKPSLGQNLARLKQRFSEAQGVGGKLVGGVGGWFLALGLELWALLWKALISLAVFITVLLKAVALILAALPFWVVSFFTRNLSRRLSDFSFSPRLGRLDFFERFCPASLTFHSLPIAQESHLWLAGRLQGGGIVRRALKWIFLMPFGSFYFILRMVIGLVLELLAKVILIAGLLLVVLVCGAASLAALVVLPLALPLIAVFNLFYVRLEAFYPRAVEWSLDNRLTVAAGSMALFLFCMYGLFPHLGRELIPEVHQGVFDIQVQLPVGTPLARTDQYLRNLEKIVIADPEVADVSTVVGVEKSSNPTSEEGENTGRLRIKVRGEGEPQVVEEHTIGRLRGKLSEIPDLRAKIVRPSLFSFKTPVEVEIHGYELASLRRLSDQAVARLSDIPGLYDVRSNIRSGNPEVRINYNRDLLAQHKLNIQRVADLVRGKVYGVVPTRFSRQERRIDIRVLVRPEDKQDVPGLGRLVVNPGDTVALPLGAVASLNLDEGPNEIRRIDQQRCALITANIAGRDLGSVSSEIAGRMLSLDMPADFSWFITGQSREMEVASRSLIFALLLAIFLVYVVMASQFESLIHPLVIMFTIPLALIGVVLALYASHTALSVVVFLGLIMLAGIVVNNAIVLVDYINHLRRSVGLGKREAIIQAGSVRLRPILMTTATTVLGLLPMALGLGEGAEIRTPMAITVIAGLVSSTVLTLVVIPVVYDLMDWRKDS